MVHPCGAHRPFLIRIPASEIPDFNTIESLLLPQALHINDTDVPRRTGFANFSASLAMLPPLVHYTARKVKEVVGVMSNFWVGPP
eukprot:20680-Pelagomonas_calceolata.AAC.1